MPGSISPFGRSVPTSQIGRRLPHRTARTLGAIDDNTTLGLSTVQAIGVVAESKLHEMGHLSREAMTGFALNVSWAQTLATGDRYLTAGLQAILDIDLAARREILADTLTDFCRERRR